MSLKFSFSRETRGEYISMNDDIRDFYLNTLRSIVKTNNGYCLQKVYDEDENGKMIQTEEDKNNPNVVRLDPSLPNVLFIKIGQIGLKEKSEFIREKLSSLLNSK